MGSACEQHQAGSLTTILRVCYRGQQAGRAVRTNEDNAESRGKDVFFPVRVVVPLLFISFRSRAFFSTTWRQLLHAQGHHHAEEPRQQQQRTTSGLVRRNDHRPGCWSPMPIIMSRDAAAGGHPLLPRPLPPTYHPPVPRALLLLLCYPGSSSLPGHHRLVMTADDRPPIDDDHRRRRWRRRRRRPLLTQRSAAAACSQNELLGSYSCYPGGGAAVRVVVVTALQPQPLS